jgi:asparagine synthase (glutamine-hydrolysing)
MCGFAGFIMRPGLHDNDMRDIAMRMADTLAHRGPDAYGTWTDAQAGVALGFRRLAIVDLSEHGHQPMTSPSGRYVLVFNGEVYNHPALRRELVDAGFSFRGHSDTEVILAAFERWGIEASVKRFIGMFAMAVWDSHERTLTLLRDRVGIKPLFVYAGHGLVSFASEIKALHRGPAFDTTIDPEAVTQFLRQLYIEAPRSIYQHVTKLMPGHLLVIRDVAGPLPPSTAYWSLEAVWRNGSSARGNGGREDAVDELDRLLRDSVALRRQADVPLGALFSGGIDSSTVVALLQEQSSSPVRTFTVAFDREEHNEAHHAARIARHLGTDHTELMVTGEDALGVVPQLADMFDEPHADTAQIPAFLVCGLARRSVTVALSGDGGDELFGGYNRYTYGSRMLPRLARIPWGVRRAAAGGLRALSADRVDRLHHLFGNVLPGSLRHRLPGEKFAKVANIMQQHRQGAMYQALTAVWQDPASLVVPRTRGASAAAAIVDAVWPDDLMDRMMYADQLGYLPDDQLAKVDRVSMAVSLEVRVPLLDHRIVEFAAALPAHAKLDGTLGKRLLREVLYRRVPRELIERPKMGFSVPLRDWLRGPLRGWAEDLLSEAALRRHGILHVAPVRRTWLEFMAGRSEHALGLWAVLMLQAWHERWSP